MSSPPRPIPGELAAFGNARDDELVEPGQGRATATAAMLRGKSGGSVPSEDSPLVPAKEGGEDDQEPRVPQKSSSDMLVKIALENVQFSIQRDEAATPASRQSKVGS